MIAPTIRRVCLALGLAAAALGSVPHAAAGAVEWRLLENVSAHEFDQRWEPLRQESYRVEWLRAFDVNARPRLAAIWVRRGDDLRWGAKYGLARRAFDELVTRLREEGSRLVDFAAFNDGGEASFLATWVANKEGQAWEASVALPADKFEAERKTRTEAGLRPLLLQAFELDRAVYYNVLWGENKERRKWSLERDLTAASLMRRLPELRAAGLRPTSYTTYSLGRVDLYGLACVENKEALDWQLFLDQAEADFRATVARLKEKYRPVAIDVYDAEGPRYGSLWVENK